MIRAATLHATLSAQPPVSALRPARLHAQRSGNIGGCDIRRGTPGTNLNLNGANLEGEPGHRSSPARFPGANLRGATL